MRPTARNGYCQLDAKNIDNFSRRYDVEGEVRNHRPDLVRTAIKALTSEEMGIFEVKVAPKRKGAKKTPERPALTLSKEARATQGYERVILGS